MTQGTRGPGREQAARKNPGWPLALLVPPHPQAVSGVGGTGELGSIPQSGWEPSAGLDA